jgi:hypothetical protein
LKMQKRYRFASDNSASRDVLPLGPDTLVVVTKRMDGGSAKSWKIAAGFLVQKGMRGPKTSKPRPAHASVAGNRWERIDISIQDVEKQLETDPRTAGILVFRSGEPLSDTFDLTSRHTSILTGEIINGWVVDTMFTDVKTDVSYISKGLPSGSAWNYCSVPYNVSGGTVYYGTNTGYGSAKTWEIRVSMDWDYWSCASGPTRDGGVDMKSYYRSVNGDTGSIGAARTWRQNYCTPPNDYPLNFINSGQVHMGDSVWTMISMYYFTNFVNVMAVNISHLMQITDTVKSPGDVFGGGVVTGQEKFNDGNVNMVEARCNNLKLMKNPHVPDSTNPNVITFGSTGNGEANNLSCALGQMKFRWWFR